MRPCSRIAELLLGLYGNPVSSTLFPWVYEFST